MVYKIYNSDLSKMEIIDLEDSIVMPNLHLEDKNEKEIYLYDVLLDDQEEGWVVLFHEKGYICLSRIGSTLEEEPIPVMNFLNKFGKNCYSIPMKIVGNTYINNIENSIATPDKSRRKFKEYLKRNNYIVNKN